MNAPRIETATWWRRPPAVLPGQNPAARAGFSFGGLLRGATARGGRSPPLQKRRGTIRTKDRLSVKQAKEMEMDWNRVEGNWKQMKGKIKEKWGNLTDDDLTAINGKRDQLEGKIQERYGIAKDQVRKDVDDWYEAQTW
jgi:uncharacterized protein YjbJ (UPF0337 family)